MENTPEWMTSEKYKDHINWSKPLKETDSKDYVQVLCFYWENLSFCLETQSAQTHFLSD